MNQTTLFTASNAQLLAFLRATGQSWRNALYIECGDCPLACSRRCHNLLVAFGPDSVPIFVPVQDIERLWELRVDQSECLAVMGKATFCALYQNWLLAHIADPTGCPLSKFYPDKQI